MVMVMRVSFRREIAFVAIITFLLGRPAAARRPVFNWNNPAGGNWSAGSNWLEGVPPSSGAGAVLVFGDPTPVSGGYTATNNLGPFTLNHLAFTSTALPGAGTPITVTGDA